jgi:adenosine deaminase
LRQRYSRFESLDDFLKYYYLASSVLIHEADFEALAYDYFLHAAQDGVMHAEVFFDPQAHLSRSVSYTTILNGFSAARKRAAAELGITSELICCFLRHLPVSESQSLFSETDVQQSFASGQVIGIGIDSSEKDFPPSLFTEMYSMASAKRLRLTAHAGEEGPSSYIRDALDTLKVERIDHGIRLIDDAKLMDRVRDEGIMLTVCPLSNVVLRCTPSVQKVPVRKFLDEGVKFSINSDDPAYFGGYILENYCQVQEAHGLSVQDWQTICSNAIDSSWCGSERKSAMYAKLLSVVDEWRDRLG